MKNTILLLLFGLSLTTHSQDIEKMDKKELRIALKISNSSKDSLVSISAAKDKEMLVLKENFITYKDSIKVLKAKNVSIVSLKKKSDENSKMLEKKITVLNDSIIKLNRDVLDLEKDFKISDIRSRYDTSELSSEDFVDIINMDWNEEKFNAQKKGNQNEYLVKSIVKKDQPPLATIPLNKLVDGTYILYNTNAFEPVNIEKKLVIKITGKNVISFDKYGTYKFTKTVNDEKIILNFGEYEQEGGDWTGGGEIIITNNYVKYKSLDGPAANEISNYKKLK
jgi:hypothetical protein